MYNAFSRVILQWAKVAPEPEPPIGAPGSARVFRAGRNYYYFRLARWIAGQAGALAGLMFSVWFISELYSTYQIGVTLRGLPAGAATPRATASPSPSSSPLAALSGSTSQASDPLIAPATPSPAPSPTARPRRSRAEREAEGRARVQEGFRRAMVRMPAGAFVLTTWFVHLMVFLEYVGIATFFLAIPATYALVRVEYEQHWYIVTDRSLRIRTGVLSLSESTMSFANIQQVEVKQGPIQRLLGLADVRVRSAGGSSEQSDPSHESLHTGVFRSVENAEEIRDLIVDRLKKYRETGLGDSDTRTSQALAARHERGGGRLSPDVIAAARDLLSEARALRTAADRTA